MRAVVVMQPLEWAVRDLTRDQVLEARARYDEAVADIDTDVDHQVDEARVDFAVTERIVFEAQRFDWGAP